MKEAPRGEGRALRVRRMVKGGGSPGRAAVMWLGGPSLLLPVIVEPKPASGLVPARTVQAPPSVSCWSPLPRNHAVGVDCTNPECSLEVHVQTRSTKKERGENSLKTTCCNGIPRESNSDQAPGIGVLKSTKDKKPG